MSATLNTHVVFDDKDRPWVKGTQVKVIEVILDHIAYGWSPEEIAYQHGKLLNLAQIHAALSYYYDNKLEMDAEIERQLARLAELQAASPETPGRRKLRELGLRP